MSEDYEVRVSILDVQRRVNRHFGIKVPEGIPVNRLADMLHIVGLTFAEMIDKRVPIETFVYRAIQSMEELQESHRRKGFNDGINAAADVCEVQKLAFNGDEPPHKLEVTIEVPE